MKKIQHKLIVFAIVLAAILVPAVLVLANPYKVLEYTQPQAELYVGASANPNVYDPVNITSGYEPGDNFSVYVKVRNITDLWGVSLYMNYNSTVLNCTDVRYGASWGTAFTDYIFIAGTINRTKGSIEYYDAGRISAPLANYSTLYDIDFHVLNLGESKLQISDTPTELRNSSILLIYCPITDGYFIPEFPLAMIPPLLIIVTLAVVAIGKKVSIDKAEKARFN